MTTDLLPGLELAALRAWIDTELPGRLAGDLSAELITGGRSNLTYVLSAGAERVVLRRPPVGELLATAHDMTREGRVMHALQRTDVPVPAVLAQCADPSVLGAPFYVMELVPGNAYRRKAEIEHWGSELTESVSGRLVDVLTALHAVDPVEVGLQDLGRPGGFLTRQVRRWRSQFAASQSRDLPDLARLYALLEASVPDGGPVGVVHGDYRLDNVLTSPAGDLLAVIDWEMATLGDTLTDLALMLVYGRVGEIAGGEAVADASSAPGFLDEDGIVERYERSSGADLSDLGFYLGLASFKLAGIFEGIHHRYLQGQTVGPGFDRVGTLTQPLLAAGISSMKERH